MADLFLSTNRGGVYKPVAIFPNGGVEDGVFNIVKDGQKYIRTRVGPVNLQEADIQADGTNQGVKLSTILELANLRELEFALSEGGEVTITTVVTVPEDKILNIKAGTKIKTTGSGAVNGGIIDADPYQEIFTGTRNVNPAGSTKGYLSANWYGVNAVGYTQTTNADNANLAAQIIINSDTLPQNLYFPDPAYSFNKPIQLYKWDGTNYVQHYIGLSGNSEGAMQGRGTTFYFDCPLAFGIGIHVGKGCIIKDLKIIGTFNPSFASMKAFVETSRVNYGSGSGCIDLQNATHGGVLIDYLRSDVPPSGGYTTILSQYRGANTGSGSTFCQILNCTITGWVTGVGFSINGQTQNCDSMLVSDCCVEGNKYAFSFGQDQTRNCWIRNILCWNSTHTFLTNSTHGNQSGAPPSLSNISLAGQINQVFNITTSGRSGFTANQIFAESVYRIGTIGGRPSSIKDSEFDFLLVSGVHAGLGAPDLYANLNNVTMENCQLRNYDNLFDKRCNMAASSCTFINVRFDLPPLMQSLNDGTGNHFIGCSYGGGSGIPLGARSSVIQYPEMIAYAVQHGKFTITDQSADPVGNLTYTSEYDFPCDYENRGGLGTITVTVDAATRTATFPSTDLLVVGQIGEYITSSTAVNHYDDAAGSPLVVMGKVTGYAANVVTLSQVPINIVTGSYALFVSAYKTVGFPFIGDTTAASAVITNVEYGLQPPVVGQRLTGGVGASNGQGVYNVYSIITAVNTGDKTVTINIAALQTLKDVSFVTSRRIAIYSINEPDSATLNSIAYPMYEGTEFIVQGKAFADGRVQSRKYRIVKGGNLNMGVSGSLRQAAWALEVPIRQTAGVLEQLSLTAGTWSALEGAVVPIVITATDANSTMAIDTDLEILPTVTGNRILTLPTASALTGKIRRIWNKNSTGFSWTLTPVISLPDDTTTSTIVNDTFITLQSNGSVWVRVDGGTSAPAAPIVITATDANATMAGDTDLEILPLVTANRTLTLPSAAALTGKIRRIWNKNTHATLNWSFAAAITLPDGTTSTLIPKNYITTIQSDGSVWFNVYPALVSDSTIGGSGSEADPLHVDSVRSFTTGALPASGNDGQMAYDETVDKLKVRQSGAWTAQT